MSDKPPANRGDTEVADLREKYRAERDRRIRLEGTGHYRGAAGSFGY